MANRLRGEVDFELDGKTYTVRLDINALIEAEGLGVDFNDTAGLQKIGTMRAILWAGLRAKHPELDDLIAVGQLMTDLGVPAIAEIVGSALKSAFPDPSESGGNPQKPSRGAGKSS